MSNAYMHPAKVDGRASQPHPFGAVFSQPSRAVPHSTAPRDPIPPSALQCAPRVLRLASAPHWVAPPVERMAAEWQPVRPPSSTIPGGLGNFAQLWGASRNSVEALQAPVRLSLVNAQPSYMSLVDATQFPYVALGTAHAPSLVRTGVVRSASANEALSRVVGPSSASAGPSRARSGLLPLAAGKITLPKQHLSILRRSLTPLYLKTPTDPPAKTAALPPFRIASASALGTHLQNDTGGITARRADGQPVADEPPRGSAHQDARRRIVSTPERSLLRAAMIRKARSCSPSQSCARYPVPLEATRMRGATSEHSVRNVSREARTRSSGSSPPAAPRREEQEVSTTQRHALSVPCAERASTLTQAPKVVINLTPQEVVGSTYSASLATTAICRKSDAPSHGSLGSQSHASSDPSLKSDDNLDSKVDHMLKRIQQLTDLMASHGVRRSSKSHHLSKQMRGTADATRRHGRSSSSASSSFSSENTGLSGRASHNSTIVDEQCHAPHGARRGRTTVSRGQRSRRSLRSTLRRIRRSSTTRTSTGTSARESRDLGPLEDIIRDMFQCVERAMESKHEAVEDMHAELHSVRTVLQNAGLLEDQDKETSVVDIVSATVHLLQCAQRENEEYRTEIHHLADRIGVRALLSSTARTISTSTGNINDTHLRYTVARVLEELTRINGELRESHNREAELLELVNLTEDKHDRIREFCALLQHYAGEGIAFVLAKVYRLENENKYMLKRLQTGNVVEGACPCCGQRGDASNASPAPAAARQPEAALIEATERVARSYGGDRASQVDASHTTPRPTATTHAAKVHTGRSTYGGADHIAGAVAMTSCTLRAPPSVRDGTLARKHSNGSACYPTDSVILTPDDATLPRAVREHTITEKPPRGGVGHVMDSVAMMPDSLLTPQTSSIVGYQANSVVAVPNGTSTPPPVKCSPQMGKLADDGTGGEVGSIAMPREKRERVTRGRPTEDDAFHAVDSTQMSLDDTTTPRTAIARAKAQGDKLLADGTGYGADSARMTPDNIIMPHTGLGRMQVDSDRLLDGGADYGAGSTRMTFDATLPDPEGEHAQGEGPIDGGTSGEGDKAQMTFGDITVLPLVEERVSAGMPHGSGAADASTVASSITATHYSAAANNVDLFTRVPVQTSRESYARCSTVSQGVMATDAAPYGRPIHERSAIDRNAVSSAMDVAATGSNDGIDEMDAVQLRAELRRIRNASATPRGISRGKDGTPTTAVSSTPVARVYGGRNANLLVQLRAELSKNMDQAERIASDHADLAELIRNEKATVDLGAELREELELLRTRSKKRCAPAMPSSPHMPQPMEEKMPQTSMSRPSLADEIDAMAHMVSHNDASSSGTTEPPSLR
eukprot:GEMP01002370.1.p1 GENE.GEMP01002370.1~~GEMP01002370.1.p1  ORF type:complete len:1362 (+),score=365.30 GEMP01002370.1:55-4140(+)